MLACEMAPMGFGMWGFGGVFTALLAAGGAWIAVVFTRRRANDGARGALERRFAEGEIDEEEFQRRRRILEASR